MAAYLRLLKVFSVLAGFVGVGVLAAGVFAVAGVVGWVAYKQRFCITNSNKCNDFIFMELDGRKVFSHAVL